MHPKRLSKNNKTIFASAASVIRDEIVYLISGQKLRSLGLNIYVDTVDALQSIFSTYPHQPTPVDPGMLALSLGLSNTPIIGDLYDLYTGAGAHWARL